MADEIHIYTDSDTGKSVYKVHRLLSDFTGSYYKVYDSDGDYIGSFDGKSDAIAEAKS
jgi:hypothetical protein